MWELWVCRSGRVSAESHSASDFHPNAQKSKVLQHSSLTKITFNLRNLGRISFNLRFPPKNPQIPNVLKFSSPRKIILNLRFSPKFPKYRKVLLWPSLSRTTFNLRFPPKCPKCLPIQLGCETNQEKEWGCSSMLFIPRGWWWIKHKCLLITLACKASYFVWIMMLLVCLFVWIMMLFVCFLFVCWWWIKHKHLLITLACKAAFFVWILMFDCSFVCLDYAVVCLFVDDDE